MGNYNYDNLYKLALTTNSVAINNDYMSFTDGVVVNGAIGAGIEGLRIGGGKVKNIFSKNKPSKFTEARKKVELRQLKGKNIFETYGNAKKYNTIVELEKSLPKLPTGGATDHFSNARNALTEAKTLRGAAQVKKIKEAEQLIAQAKLAAYNAKPVGKLKTLTGIKAGNKALKTLAANSSKFRAVTKFVKGNALFTLMSVACNYDKFATTEAVCGKKARNKEIAKSVGVAVAESVGFMAGMKAGAALGTAIGSAVPGVGNIVGAVAGAVIGGLVSWGAGKVAHKAMGKSEVEKHNEEQARLWALKSKYNMETRETLLANATAKLSQDIQISNATPEELAQAGIQPIDQEKLQEDLNVFETAKNDNPEIFAKMIAESQAAQQEVAQTKQDEANETSSAQETSADASEKDKAMQKTMKAFTDRISGVSNAQPWQLNPTLQYNI